MSGRILHELSQMATQAIKEALGVDVDDPDVRACTDPKFGDYQINGVLPLAKTLRDNPRKLAQKVVDVLDTGGMCGEPSLAGPGFINLKLNDDWVAKTIGRAATDDRLGIAKSTELETIVVDFSSPNVAKRMHVGHLRSTVLGDALVRTLRFLGDTVIGDNHVGDWGTQFGILIWAWKQERDEVALASDPIGELERLYKLGSARGKEDEAIADACRAELAGLQAGDPENLALWERFVEISRIEAQKAYDRLEVEFDTWHGESHYNDALAGVVDSLLDAGIARETEGAIGVFFDESEKLGDIPFLVRKRDGAFNYATSDIATVLFRVREYSADRMLYVVDSRQQEHFRKLFATMAKMGHGDLDLEHVHFGMILGDDGKPFKTRSGETVALSDLLDEAEERILPKVAEKWPDVGEVEQRRIAQRVGIGAVKYADMAQHRATDYKFEWDKLLAAEGNTGPYLQYTLVRSNSVVREYESRQGSPFVASGAPLRFERDEERELARELTKLGDTLERVRKQLLPHILCEYLYVLARKFNAFYAKCKVLGTDDEALRESRMALVVATARGLDIGLSCLNIPRMARM